MILGLHHAQLTIPVGEENAAKAFYCDLLGLKEIVKPVSLQARGGFWLQVGQQEVHIGTEDGVHRMATKAHLAYEVEDLSYWKKIFNDLQIEVITGIPIPGFDRFECRDPFGNRLEMIQRIKKTPNFKS